MSNQPNRKDLEKSTHTFSACHEKLDPAIIITRNEAMLKILDEIRLVGPTEAGVLISGETGTGKNLVAKAIHLSHPKRSGHEFRRTNLGALVPELAASQLYGHVKGAFTGAERGNDGIVVEADQGTLFLDELSTATLNVQIMLLTLLEVLRVKPVGASIQHYRPVDIRAIAATTETPHGLLYMASFRQELFYRVAEYVIEIPPLRERREDIPLLALHFMDKANKPIRRMPEEGKNFVELTTISEDAVAKLSDGYQWPGNVRELEHVVRAAVVRSREVPEATSLCADWIEFPTYGVRSGKMAQVLEFKGLPDYHEAVEKLQQWLCNQAYYNNGQVASKAAEALGIDSKTFKKHHEA